MNRNLLSKACKISLLAVVATVVFVGLEIARNENRLEKVAVNKSQEQHKTEDSIFDDVEWTFRLGRKINGFWAVTLEYKGIGMTTYITTNINECLDWTKEVSMEMEQSSRCKKCDLE